MKHFKLLLSFIFIIFIFSCSKKQKSKEVADTDQSAPISLIGKKIYYLDSYHSSYPNNSLTREIFAERLENRGVEIRYEFLNSKTVKDSISLTAASLKLKGKIEEWKPDLIIAADDAINKYLISPYFRNSEIPVIFIGVNWDAKQYGYPCSNITGQIEVELFSKLVSNLKKLSHGDRGDRVGVLTGNTLTDKKNIDYYKNILNINIDEEIFVDNFDEWKKAYLKLQNSVDILILRSKSGILGWSEEEAMKFIRFNTKIPSGSSNIGMENFVLLDFPKLNSEFGEYAAKTAIKILQGVAPSKIPITQNRKSKIFLNMKIAKELGVIFPPTLLDLATLIGVEKSKILYVNSYHRGYEWSDGIEKGLIKALGVKPKNLSHTSSNTLINKEYDSPEIDLKIFRMGTKLNKTELYKKQSALSAKLIIDSWNPDLLIISDDNAAKYLLDDLCKNSNIPTIFCGVNWTISDYKFPSNITGMIEVKSILEPYHGVLKYAKGNRVGTITSSTISAQKNLSELKKQLGEKIIISEIVETFEEWKKAYLKIQTKADILYLGNYAGITNWNGYEAEQFVLENTTIPSCSFSKAQRRFAMFIRSHIPEEQGWWSGKAAKDIIRGKDITEIKIVKNSQTQLFLNMKIAKVLGTLFPPKLLEQAELISE